MRAARFSDDVDFNPTRRSIHGDSTVDSTTGIHRDVCLRKRRGAPPSLNGRLSATRTVHPANRADRDRRNRSPFGLDVSARALGSFRGGKGWDGHNRRSRAPYFALVTTRAAPRLSDLGLGYRRAETTSHH